MQSGKDVVVQAPTGSGETYIFELLYPNLKTQAVHRPDPRRDNVQRYRAELEHGIAGRAEPRSSGARSRDASKTTVVANDAS